MRYETGIPIGRGAGGEVFKAWDPVAERTVALKLFAPDDDPSTAARREREARAQAGLKHPSICEIYEVGETPGGRPFIAMRYVDGEPLDTICARLPVPRRLELVAQVADAVGTAHAAGLVHRDLKPSNILVEEQEGGTLRAFVLDFGIVRMAEETRLTETGHVLGTPGYLSPEQARGARVDSRSDVFALGILLYQVLTGRLPFEASGVGAVLQVLEQDPPLAHRLYPEVPPELGHIAQKAMEKDPRRRYSDADAMGRDLRRYLEGTGTAARKVGLVGRWVRRVERRPRLWLGGLALLLVALASVAWGAADRLVAERRTRDAEIFARRSTEIEARARYVQLLPRHSIEPTRQALLLETDRLAEDVSRADGSAAAAGLYALGKAELALGRVDRAVASLEQARGAGFTEPVLGLDLALARLRETRERLRQVELAKDPEDRRALKEEIRRELQDRLPPLEAEELPDSDQDALELGDSMMIRSLKALLEGAYDPSRTWARRLVELEPWRFEADLIVADTYRDEASESFLGEDSTATATSLEAEKEVVEQALQRAPSAPELYRRLCDNRLAAARVELAVGRPAETWEAGFDAAETACTQAVSVLPSDLPSRSLAVEVRWRRDLAQLSRRGRAQELVDGIRLTIADARALLRHPDAGYREHQNLGNALLAEAQALRELGRPSPELYEQAAEALERGLVEAPGSALGWQSLGIAWTRHGEALVAEGSDPRGSYTRAVDAYRQSLRGERPGAGRVWNSICFTHNASAYYGARHAAEVDPREVDEAFDAAEAACERSLALVPDYVSARSNLGLVYWSRVEWDIAQGRDPTDAFRKGRQTFDALLQAAPEHVSGRINLAGLIAAMARHRLDLALAAEERAEGLDDLVADLRRARELVHPLRSRFPTDIAIQLSRLHTLEAAALCAAGEPSADAFAAAEKAAERLGAEGGWQSLQHLLRARFHLRRAECRRHRGEPAQDDLAAALAAVELALESDPTSIDAASLKSVVRALAAEPPTPP